MERYEILKRTYREEYLKDCPLLLINSGLTYDREKNEVLAQFKFQNLGHKIIKAVYVKIFCSGPGNEPLENAAQFIYLDLSVQSLAIFGGDIPISLPNNRTRNVLLTCTKVVFVDETVWCNEENKNYNPLPPKQPLQRCLSEELYEELLNELSEERVVCQDVYFPCELENIRFCPCGTYYLKEDTVCPCCQKEYEWWIEIILKEKLEKNLEIRREKEQKAQEEQQRIKAEKAAERKERIKKGRKIALRVGVIIGVLCVVVAVYMYINKVIVPSRNYEQGITCMEQEEYAKAKDYFAKSSGYKDSDEQYQKAEEFIQRKTNYLMAFNKYQEGEYFDAARLYGRIQDYKDSVELYIDSLYQGVKQDIDKGQTTDTTLEALQILEDSGYEEGIYYFGKYYFLNQQYKEAYEKWCNIKGKFRYQNLEEEMSEARNKMLYQEASDLAANLKISEAYEKLLDMDAEVEDSEHMKSEIKRALDSGFLGKWIQTESSDKKSDIADDFLIIEATYRDGELRFYYADDYAVKGKKPEKLKVRLSATESGRRYHILEGETLVEKNNYEIKAVFTREGTSLKKEVGADTFVYEPYE